MITKDMLSFPKHAYYLSTCIYVYVYLTLRIRYVKFVFVFFRGRPSQKYVRGNDTSVRGISHMLGE